MKELWKYIPSFEGIYQISNFGRLKSFKKNPNGYILKQTNKKGGYFAVVLSCFDKKRHTRIHRLVAESFIPNIHNKYEVNHKDMNKQNNHVDNLEWVTKSENNIHASKLKPEKNFGMIRYNQIIHPKTILQFDFENNLIAEFNNSKEAQDKTGVCQRNILQVAGKDEYKPGKTRKQAGGFIWKFKED